MVPSGFANPPRPFVLRARHLDSARVSPGSTFRVDIHLFDTSDEVRCAVADAFAEIARQGIAATRSRLTLMSVQQLDCGKLDLSPAQHKIDSLRLSFLSPTELKGALNWPAAPEFHFLISRIRDRISALRQFYGSGPLEMDFREFAEPARNIRFSNVKLERVEASRRSSRSGQTHSLGGFIGAVDYHGDLSPYLPYLSAARWTGVGRQTSWGKGEIDLNVLQDW